MSQPTYCHCTHCGRESNPVWARKYDGLCLDCYNAGVGDFLDRIAELEAGRQFAADLIEDLRKQRDKFAMMAREITCVWCGHQFDSTIQSQADHLYDHAKQCEKHPIRKAEAKLAEAVELLRPFAKMSETNTVFTGLKSHYQAAAAFVADTRADLAAVRRVVE